LWAKKKFIANAAIGGRARQTKQVRDTTKRNLRKNGLDAVRKSLNRHSHHARIRRG